MIYVHEVHEVLGGKMDEFTAAFDGEWRALVEGPGHARILWLWQLAHGTGPSYQAVSLTAVRDWGRWGEVAADSRGQEWRRRAGGLRREVTAKILLPAPWSPLREADLVGPAPGRAGNDPELYLHDTGWPFTGKLDEYVEALGSVFYPLTRRARMISVVGCWTVAPGTGRYHEVVLLQRIEDWEQFARLLQHGEQGAQRGGWMEAGLRYRDRWESKLLRRVV